MDFEDYFSRGAREYARYRPSYPEELFEYLAGVVPGQQLAWDCGTGSGQAALALARHFERVVATDASPEQIEHAFSHDRIKYRVESAENVSLEANSVDLVTVAIAVHWFDLEQFYREVRRVLKPGGILAVWTYHLPSIDPAVDRVLNRFYLEVVGEYWPDRFRYVHERYRSLPFPFEELQPPEFTMVTDWDLDHVVGFLNSWSATGRYAEARGRHPLNEVWDELVQAWGDGERMRSLRWPLHCRVGINE